MKIKSLFVVVSLLFSLLAACSATEAPDSAGETPGEASATQALDASEPGDPGYPEPEVAVDAGYPALVSEEFEANLTPVAPEPEFSSDTGAMTVVLRYPDGERPVRGQLFFAAGTLPVEGVDGGFIPVHDQVNDPSGHSDAQGKLVISNIPPGQYALVLFTPLGSVLVENSATNEALVFDIIAGELLDLGEIVVFLNAETLEP